MTPQKVKEILEKYLRESPSLLELQNITYALNQIIKEQNKEYIEATKTFESHGLVWTRHKPGDPMPCKDDDKVCVIYDKDDMFNGGYIEAECFDWLNSSGLTPITGWRYADKKIVKLGVSDIPPGSMFRFNGGEAIFQWTRIKKDGINFAGDINIWHTFEELKNSKFEINRPKNRDADGNPTLWEQCSKEEV